jgi:hypothetical protein
MVVDSKHKLIVTHEVTTAVTDKDQLAPMAKAAKQVLERVDQQGAWPDRLPCHQPTFHTV